MLIVASFFPTLDLVLLKTVASLVNG